MIEIQIKETIAQQLNLDIEDINENADLIDDLGASSLDIIEIVMAIEEAFGITVSDSDIIDNRTVGDIIEYIKINM